MNKKVLILFLIIILFSLSFVSADKDEIYTFDEPSKLFWMVKQHIDTTYQCPEENSVSEIRKKVDKLIIIKERISDDDIQVFKEQCENSHFFLMRGVETEGEIKECFDYLSHLLEDKDLSAPHIRWLYKECYVRSHFKERFNPETLDDYNASYFENRLNERDQEFVDFIKYKIEYPKTTREEATEEGKEPTILEERNIDIEELENETSELEKYEFLPVETEEIKIPSKSLLQIIKEKIKSFFKWFK